MEKADELAELYRIVAVALCRRLGGMITLSEEEELSGFHVSYRRNKETGLIEFSTKLEATKGTA